MTRRRIATPSSLRASGDRWLFGYADVVTLLFACFAALYAAQVTPAASAERTLEPLNRTPVAPAPAAAETGNTLARDISRLSALDARLHMELTPIPSGIVVSMPESGTFAPGRAELSAAAERAIEDLAAILRGRPFTARVEGHTDDVPIRTSKYESNWELSTARATRVVQFLVERGGLPPSQLSAAGYGQYHPRVANSDPELRARNRRVDIVVFDAGVQELASAADYQSVGVVPAGRK